MGARWRAVALLFVTTVWAGCAGQLGPPDPVERQALALHVAGSATPEETADRIRAADVDYVLISAPQEAPWFEAVAAGTGLTLSGPGPTGTSALAFLGPEALGDTTIAIPFAGDRLVVLHDALYQVDNRILLDLLAFRIESSADARPLVASLLRYIATDVAPQAAILVAAEVPDAAAGDSLAVSLSPAFSEAGRCASAEMRRAADDRRMRLFIGPRARIRCERAEFLEAPGVPVLVDLLVG